MSKKAFDKIAAGLNEALAIAKGEADPSTYRVHVPKAIDVKAIRNALDLTQQDFAMRFGFAVQSLRDWEQGRSQPTGSVRAYLLVIANNPEAVMKALRPKSTHATRVRSKLMPAE
jgi:putative transcriptional regulator